MTKIVLICQLYLESLISHLRVFKYQEPANESVIKTKNGSDEVHK